MSFATLRAASYVLVNAPELLLSNGSTQETERATNPDSEYLKVLPDHLRTFDEVVNYAPNQTYIGNMNYEELADSPEPWHENSVEGSRWGKFGEIMPELEFYGLLMIADVFELVYLENDFAEEVKQALAEHPLFTEEDIADIKYTKDFDWIQDHVDNQGANPLYYGDKLVGCVNRAHEIDQNLSSQIMLENLAVKASGILAVRHLLHDWDIDPMSVGFVIECSEEACGDVLQRGGGNFAKAIAEHCGLGNASGRDIRSFCAAPTHSLVDAASLVQAGTYDNVIVCAGGSIAKLGMNGKSHVDKGMKVLEDCLGGFACLVSKNDGKHPVIRTDLVGTHTVDSGSTPQNVMTALVGDVLDKGDLKVTDVDVYASELQNPDITTNSGAGNVPLSNVKLIGAIGVLRKELDRAEMADFVDSEYIPGWAPTQGHIPSGAPYLGFAVHDLMEGDKQRALVIGKGSLFLGRMTNLFDGVSIMVERNSGEVDDGAGSSADLKEEVKSEVANALRQFAASISTEE